MISNQLAIDTNFLDFATIHERMNPTKTDGLPYESSNNGAIAVLTIRGALSHHTDGGLLSMLFGPTASYDQIRRDFRAALADDQVSAIVFDLDSPGGQVAGCFDLVDEIYAARGIKPIYAVANEAALSAVYAIGSAADRFYVSRTASVGSIGVMAVHVDQSGADEKMGLKFTAVYAGSHKNDLSPHSALSEKALAAIQQQVNRTYDLFVKTVARNRGLSEQAVKDTQAAIYTGDEAVKAGLADGVKAFDDVINKILSNNGVNTMSLKTDIRALIAGKAPEEIAEAFASLDFVPKQTGNTDQVKEILGLCEVAGVHDLAFVQGLINDGCTVEQARTKILEAKADEAKNQTIFSTVSALSTGAVNPLIADAQKRAGGNK